MLSSERTIQCPSETLNHWLSSKLERHRIVLHFQENMSLRDIEWFKVSGSHWFNVMRQGVTLNGSMFSSERTIQCPLDKLRWIIQYLRATSNGSISPWKHVYVRDWMVQCVRTINESLMVQCIRVKPTGRCMVKRLREIFNGALSPRNIEWFNMDMLNLSKRHWIFQCIPGTLNGSMSLRDVEWFNFTEGHWMV